MTLYGYPRDVPETPDETPPDLGGDAAPVTAHARVPQQRADESPPPAPDPALGGLSFAAPEERSGYGVTAPAEIGSAGDRVDEPAGLAPEASAYSMTTPAAVTSVAGEADADAPAASEITTAAPPAAPPRPAAPDVVPWDRKPLMIALAAATALILIGVLSGVASAAMFRDGPRWQQGSGVDPTATPSATGGPGGPAVNADTITLSGVGDVIMGTEPGDIPPHSGKGFFDPVRDALAADLVMGNLETPLTESTGYSKCAPPAPGEKNNCYQFYLDASYAGHLKDAGFHLVNLANNHTNDMGPTGLRNTRAALDAVGIRHTGTLGEITVVQVNGIKVAVLGFSPFSSSGKNLLNIAAAKTLVAQAAAQADLVVIQMQGGAEGSDKTHVRPGHEIFSGEDRGDLVAFSHAVVDAGADIVFGHGPHIMRGMEFYKGRLIAYSLGNFCGYGVLNSSGYLGVGGVLKVTLKRDGSWVGGNLVPTEMVRGGMVAIDTEKRAVAFVDGLSKSDFGADAAAIAGGTGEITPPATS